MAAIDNATNFGASELETDIPYTCIEFDGHACPLTAGLEGILTYGDLNVGEPTKKHGFLEGKPAARTAVACLAALLVVLALTGVVVGSFVFHRARKRRAAKKPSATDPGLFAYNEPSLNLKESFEANGPHWQVEEDHPSLKTYEEHFDLNSYEEDFTVNSYEDQFSLDSRHDHFPSTAYHDPISSEYDFESVHV
jgi:hypothetical protein